MVHIGLGSLTFLLDPQSDVHMEEWQTMDNLVLHVRSMFHRTMVDQGKFLGDFLDRVVYYVVSPVQYFSSLVVLEIPIPVTYAYIQFL